MTEDDRERRRAAALRLMERTRREQGLPPYVEDPATLALVAALLDR